MIGSVGISSTPLVLELVLFDLCWRTAWLIEGITIWLVVTPLGLFAMRNRSADLGRHPEGPLPAGHAPPVGALVGGLTRTRTGPV